MILSVMELNYLLELSRNHIPEIMYKLFSIAGYDKTHVHSKFSGMINALKFWSSTSWRYSARYRSNNCMLLAGEKNISEVTLFPMNQNAEDLMMKAPSEIEEKSIKRIIFKNR